MTDIAQVDVKTEGLENPRLANSIQVCLDRAPMFYARIGRRMLHGSDDERDAGKPTFDEVVITGLGTATKTAVGAASFMERDEQAFIKSIETSYFSSSRSARRLPKVTITMLKNPNAPSPPPYTRYEDRDAPVSN